MVEEKQTEQMMKKTKETKENQAEVEVPEKFKKLVTEIEQMKVGDLAELVKVLEKKFGVSTIAPSPIAMAPGTEAPSGAAATQEKTFLTVVLIAVGEKKIEVIKAVRDITQKGLKEAKDLVDAVAGGPQLLRENVKREEAEQIKKKLEEAGAKVELN